MGYPIEKGEIECNAPGQNASYDSILSCILFQIPFKLELIGFGYICLGLLIPIILISIFGKIREQYRWFILNQAIWDLLITYDYICEKPTYYGYYQRQVGPETMFYEPAYCIYGNTRSGGGFFFYATKAAIKHISYIPLFLLTFSRFICLYYNPFYQRHSSTVKLLFVIVLFNLVFLILITSKPLYDIFEDVGRITRENDERFRYCHLNNCPRNPETLIPNCNQTLIDECVATIPVYDYTLSYIFQYIKQALSIIFLISSIILAILMTIKVGKQLKFQLEHNRSSLQTTLRISAVCLFQCFTMTCMLLLILFHTIRDLDNFIPNLNLYDFFANLSSWEDLFQQDFTVQSFNVIRVFLDSFIVLTVLNGYRKNCKYFVIFVFRLFTNPKNAFNSDNFGSTVTTSRVTTISINKSR